MKGHPQPRGLRNKSFSYYDNLFNVFGKDRADGYDSESPYHMSTPADLEEEKTPEFQEFNVGDPPMVDQFMGENASSTTTSRSGRKKRRVPEELNDIFCIEMRLNTNQLEKIAEWPEKKREADSAKRKQLFDEIQSILGMAMEDCLVIADTLLSDATNFNSFLDFSNDWKRGYCMCVMGRDDT